MKLLFFHRNTRRTPQNLRAKRRVFFATFSITFVVLMLVVGLITVDYQRRRMSFGEQILPVSILHGEGEKTTLRLRFFEVDTGVDITLLKNFFDFCCDFCCIPHK